MCKLQLSGECRRIGAIADQWRKAWRGGGGCGARRGSGGPLSQQTFRGPLEQGPSVPPLAARLPARLADHRREAQIEVSSSQLELAQTRSNLILTQY